MRIGVYLFCKTHCREGLMLETFLNDFLLINVKDYFSDTLDFYINIFLLSVAVGLCIAAFCITVHKRYTALILKQLIRHKAYSEDGARTLAELHIKSSFFLRAALSRRGQLTDMVRRTDASEYTYEELVKLQREKKYKEEKIDFNTARFFIAEEKIGRAEKITAYPPPTYITTALGCVFILALFVCIALFMPEILSFISGLVK